MKGIDPNTAPAMLRMSGEIAEQMRAARVMRWTIERVPGRTEAHLAAVTCEETRTTSQGIGDDPGTAVARAIRNLEEMRAKAAQR